MDAPCGTSFRTKAMPVTMQLTDSPPSVSCVVDFHSRSVNVGGVAIIGEPHVFDMKVVEGLVTVLSAIQRMIAGRFFTL